MLNKSFQKVYKDFIIKTFYLNSFYSKLLVSVFKQLSLHIFRHILKLLYCFEVGNINFKYLMFY